MKACPSNGKSVTRLERTSGIPALDGNRQHRLAQRHHAAAGAGIYLPRHTQRDGALRASPHRPGHHHSQPPAYRSNRLRSGLYDVPGIRCIRHRLPLRPVVLELLAADNISWPGRNDRLRAANRQSQDPAVGGGRTGRNIRGLLGSPRRKPYSRPGSGFPRPA